MDQNLKNEIESAAIGFWILYNYDNRHNNIEWLDLLKQYHYDHHEIVNIRDITNRNNISP